MKLIFCLDPLRVSITGIGRYTYELAKGFRDNPQLEDLKYQYLLGWISDPELLINKYHSSEGTSNRAITSFSKNFIHSAVRSTYRMVSPAIKGLVTRQYKNYIYHSPNFVLPNFSGKCVSTVHDMSVFRLPKYHPPSRVSHQHSLFKPLIKRGSLFITDSEFSKTELLEYFPAAEGRVVSVPLGVDPKFCTRLYSAIETTLAKYSLIPGRYALSVGTIEPRKNIIRLVQAYAQLPADLREYYSLVLVGGHGWNSEDIHKLIASCSAQGWLKYLEYVSDQDLAIIYSGARLFACISHYEGFGLPVLEAMASGIPVISSGVTSLPEVGGNAAVYVDQNDTESISYAFQKILQDDAYCQNLSIKGLERSKLFSWDRTINETLSAYKQIS